MWKRKAKVHETENEKIQKYKTCLKTGVALECINDQF